MTNHQRVGEALHILTAVLAPFVARKLRATLSNGWWEKGVIAVLRDSWRQNLPSTGRDERLVASLDAAVCLRLMDIWWHDVFRHELNREAKNWIHELISTRNRWAHAGREDLADDDAWRALDTVVRLLEPIDDRAIEPLRPMIRTLRYGAPGRAGPLSLEVPQARTEPSEVGELARAEGKIEVRDAVLWVKHIRHNEPFRNRLAELSEGTRIELEIDGFRGTWEKMRDGRDGRPTPGLKPQGTARAHWRGLYEKKRGTEVTIAIDDQ